MWHMISIAHGSSLSHCIQTVLFVAIVEESAVKLIALLTPPLSFQLSADLTLVLGNELISAGLLAEKATKAVQICRE